MRGSQRSATILSSALRLLGGFAVGVAVWLALSPAYERTLASVGETLLRATEWPAVTRLSARGGEILVDRADFPPAAPRPGLPAADLHFNFALLAALFALTPKPWRSESLARFALACALLWVVHLVALVFQVRAVYTTRLGEWSAQHYGAIARNFWAGGFHFYQIAGRFAAPFAIWWATAGISGSGESSAGETKGPRPRRKAGGARLRVVR